MSLLIPKAPFPHSLPPLDFYVVGPIDVNENIVLEGSRSSLRDGDYTKHGILSTPTDRDHTSVLLRERLPASEERSRQDSLHTIQYPICWPHHTHCETSNAVLR